MGGGGEIKTIYNNSSSSSNNNNNNHDDNNDNDNDDVLFATRTYSLQPGTAFASLERTICNCFFVETPRRVILQPSRVLHIGGVLRLCWQGLQYSEQRTSLGSKFEG